MKKKFGRLMIQEFKITVKLVQSRQHGISEKTATEINKLEKYCIIRTSKIYPTQF